MKDMLMRLQISFLWVARRKVSFFPFTLLFDNQSNKSASSKSRSRFNGTCIHTKSDENTVFWPFFFFRALPLFLERLYIISGDCFKPLSVAIFIENVVTL